jgi:hypothetical protein
MRTLVISALFLLSSCEPINRYLGLRDDNIGEELVEAAIQMETGINVDLTPSSPE